MRKILPISILVLSALACGVSSKLKVYPQRDPAPTPPEYAVQMIVSGTWNIRTKAGETNPLVDGKNTLHDGEIITCTEFLVVGEGLWCHHERGWTNTKGMIGYNEVKEK